MEIVITDYLSFCKIPVMFLQRMFCEKHTPECFHESHLESCHYWKDWPPAQWTRPKELFKCLNPHHCQQKH